MKCVNTYENKDDHPEHVGRRVEAEERGRNQQEHLRDLGLRHPVAGMLAARAPLVGDVRVDGQGSASTVQPVDVARNHRVEDHDHRERQHEWQDGVDTVIDIRPQCPVIVEIANNYYPVGGVAFRAGFSEQQYRATPDHRDNRQLDDQGLGPGDRAQWLTP